MDPSMPTSLRTFIRDLLNDDEIQRIDHQFSRQLESNQQVLWTGMTREFAQKWADSHGLQTLTTVMGPLMDPNDDSCPRGEKTTTAWTKYIHGASAIFAWRISKGDVVTVLSHPPPERFHPSGLTNFQLVEEPIITGKLGNRPVREIKAVHPAVSQAANFRYQLWPSDDGSLWLSKFGQPKQSEKWRAVKSKKPSSGVLPLCESPDQGLGSNNNPALVNQAQKTKKSTSQPTQASGLKQSKKALMHAKRQLEEKHRKEKKDFNRRESTLMKSLCEEQARERQKVRQRTPKKHKSLLRRQAKKRHKLLSAGEERRKALAMRQDEEMDKQQEEARRVAKRPCDPVEDASQQKGISRQAKKRKAAAGDVLQREHIACQAKHNPVAMEVQCASAAPNSERNVWAVIDALPALNSDLGSYAASIIVALASWGRLVCYGTRRR